MLNVMFNVDVQCLSALRKVPKHPTLPRACTGERCNNATLAPACRSGRGSNERRKVEVPFFGVDSTLNVRRFRKPTSAMAFVVLTPIQQLAIPQSEIRHPKWLCCPDSYSAASYSEIRNPKSKIQSFCFTHCASQAEAS
jgi:hypothetical protein